MSNISDNISKDSSISTIITHDWEHYFTSKLKPCEKAVERGLFLGKKLLTKLQTRNSIKKDIESEDDHIVSKQAQYDKELFNV